MATISTAIQLQDNITPVMRSMNSAVNICIASFDAMQNASSHAVNVANLAGARTELNKASMAMDAVEQNIRIAGNAQRQLNSDIRNGQSGAVGLIGKFKGVYQVVETVVSTIGDWLELADAQIAAENQLAVVMQNKGATKDEYEAIKNTASQMQATTPYSANNLVAGAAELANHLKSGDAIEAMMGTLADYAAGMGGVEVDQGAMVGYASQLGKALDGDLQGLSMKGFEPSDLQKEILTYGSELERVAVIQDIIAQSWDGLAESMANTPQGQLMQMENNWNGIKASIGSSLYPAVLQLFKALSDNMPLAESVMKGFAVAVAFGIDILGGVVSLIANSLSGAGDRITWAIDSAISVLQFLGNVVWGIMPIAVGLLVGYGAYWLIANANMLVNAGIASVVAARAWAVATAQAAWAAITGALTTAQRMLNLVIAFNPIGLLIGLIVGAIAIFGAWQVKTYGIRNTFAAVFGFIVDIVETAVNSIVAAINTVIRAFNSVGGFAGKLMGFEYSQIEEITFKAEFSARKLEAQDFIKNGSIASLTDKFNPPGISPSILPGTSPSLWPVSSGSASPIDNVAATAANTSKMRDSLNTSTEDLKYLRDIAEREVINRFTTAELNVSVSNQNNIGSSMDLDGVTTYLTDTLIETVQTAAEKVHK